MRKKLTVLNQDILDLDGRKLAEAGQELTPAFIKDLSLHRATSTPPTNLSKFPELLNDYYEFCKIPPYDKIFAEEHTREEVSNLLGRARIFPVVYESLKYFKEKEPYTYRHILMVSAMSTRMANDSTSLYRLSLEAATVTPSHDIGKMNIPLSILTKEKKLTDEEKNILREHTTVGFILLTHYLGKEDPASCQVAYEHHELMNGTGYPRGIWQTHELVQLVTVCDIFDALVMPRPYRRTNYSVRGALEIISYAALEKRLNMDFVSLLIAYNRWGRPPAKKLTLSTKLRESEPQDNNYSLAHIPIPKSKKTLFPPEDD